MPSGSAPPRLVEVTAASRLHFGLLSFGQPGVRQFGGAGVMIDEPGLRLRVVSADRFGAAGPAAARIENTAAMLTRAFGWSALPPCLVEVLAAPPAHAGLGSGTQLALATSAGLCAWQGLDQPPLEKLAAAAGRAKRSAIGAWGFALGGFLIEAGHAPPDERDDDDAMSPLVRRLALPDAWRWVLVTPGDCSGLSGRRELEAFARLPAVPAAVTKQLADELWHELLPAALAADFDRFSASLYRYGIAAGNCFVAVQGGPFASERIEAIAQAIRSLGVAGVGQSSWGPTVFALLPDHASAAQLAADLGRRPEAAGASITTSATCNRGARVVVGA